jgi:hypothetical protein
MAIHREKVELGKFLFWMLSPGPLASKINSLTKTSKSPVLSRKLQNPQLVVFADEKNRNEPGQSMQLRHTAIDVWPVCGPHFADSWKQTVPYTLSTKETGPFSAVHWAGGIYNLEITQI